MKHHGTWEGLLSGLLFVSASLQRALWACTVGTDPYSPHGSYGWVEEEKAERSFQLSRTWHLGEMVLCPLF